MERMSTEVLPIRSREIVFHVVPGQIVVNDRVDIGDGLFHTAGPSLRWELLFWLVFHQITSKVSMPCGTHGMR